MNLIMSLHHKIPHKRNSTAMWKLYRVEKGDSVV